VGRVLRAYSVTAAGERPDQRDLLFYVVDLDDFKAVNDLYGHDAGDRVLADTAARLTSVARQSDLLVRWGGQEFLVVSRDAGREGGEGLAQRILDVIGQQPFDAGGGRSARLTCSIGWAPFPWLIEEPTSVSHETVLKIADRALYHAKNAGRNLAVGASPAPGRETDSHPAEIPFHAHVLAGPAG
jgi:diguanylate cyclase (GGDEF)-like protein